MLDISIMLASELPYDVQQFLMGGAVEGDSFVIDRKGFAREQEFHFNDRTPRYINETSRLVSLTICPSLV